MEKIPSSPKTVTCPTCAAAVDWTAKQRWRPFCSERCRLVDLGKWFDESNRIPAEQGLPEKPPPP